MKFSVIIETPNEDLAAIGMEPCELCVNLTEAAEEMRRSLQAVTPTTKVTIVVDPQE